MDFFKYYNDLRVTVLRTFVFFGENYSEINDGVEDKVVKSADLSDQKTDIIDKDEKFSSTITNLHGEVLSEIKVNKDEIISSINITDKSIELEADKIVLDDISTPSIVEEINNSGNNIDIGNGSHMDISGETTFAVPIIASNNKGKKIKLGVLSALSENKDVKRLKLNPEAIELCLNGKQKQHKGWTFAYESK